MLGFDHVEIGTVTGRAQPGNPQEAALPAGRGPRADQPDGLQQRRLGGRRRPARPPARTVFRTTVGVNIGKTKAVPEGEAVADYVTSTERLAAHADYLVVNVSLPEHPRTAQPPGRPTTLRPLLTAVREAADRTVTDRRVPLLVKIAPDLADEDVDAVADLAVELGLDGIIATNTTIAREGLGLHFGPGTVPPRPAACPARRSRTARWRCCAGCTRGSATGSRWSASAASSTPRTPGSGSWPAPRSSRATRAFVYEGPFWMRAVHQGLAARLAASPYATLADAVGADHRKVTT